MKIIAVTGDKGGVGKSTITSLLAQWFMYQNYTINVLDADPNRTIATWLEKCTSQGYNFCTTKDPDLLLVDTAGTTGSSLIRHVREANIIVIPFQPHVADLEIVIGWFLSVNESLQQRVVFIPNRLEGTNEQKEGVSQIAKIIAETGRGTLLSGFSNRPAVYPTLLNGSATNYLTTLKDQKVHKEINDNLIVMQQLL